MANFAVLAGSDYIGTPNQLGGCGNDVRDMSELLNQGGFTTTVLTDATGLTYTNGAKVKVAGLPNKDLILSNLNKAISSSKPGDTIVFYYSGHGTQIPGDDGTERDYIVPLDVVTNGFDEDKLISSDELHNMLLKVPVGVKLLMVADSCFSGNIDELDNTTKALGPIIPFKHLRSLLEARSANAHGALTLIAGCKANQESTDLGSNGALTAAIKNWIANNSVAKWLTACWDYAGNTLSQLKAALTATIKKQGITDQDPQISFDRDTSQPAPAPTPATTHHWWSFVKDPAGFFNKEHAQRAIMPVTTTATPSPLPTAAWSSFVSDPHGFWAKRQAQLDSASSTKPSVDPLKSKNDEAADTEPTKRRSARLK